MRRRHFLSLVTAVVTLPFASALGRPQAPEIDVPTPPDQLAPEWDGVTYLDRSEDARIRSITVRVSYWDDPHAAGAVAGSLTANAGTPLPEGEFYHSAVTDWTPRVEVEDLDQVTGREWDTAVGVAAFTTYWAQLVAWQDRRVTVVLVSGGAAAAIRRETSRLADLVLYWEPMPCGPPPDTLPTIDELPAGMELVWRADEDGPWSASELEDGMSRLAECTLVEPPD